MRTLVTGAAGFIGSNFVRLMLDETDDQLTIYDKLTYAGNRATIADLLEQHADRVRFVHADICDPGTLSAAMAGHQRVVHFAAESHVDRSIESGTPFAETNCVGTAVVMGCALQAGVTKVVHVSTDEVYGSVESGQSAEDDLLDPRSPYSASKAGSDLIARSYFSTYGLPVSVTRASNTFGPWQFPEKALPLFITNLLDGGTVPLYGDGLNVRDWLWATDHCRAVKLVAESGVNGEIYNIGSGTELTNTDLVDKVLVLMGESRDRVEMVPDRLGHDRRYAVDDTKIRGLGWRATGEFDHLLEETIAWYRDNRWWWEPLKAAAAA